MKRFIIGLTLGIMLSSGVANAGIISHVLAYQMGKSAGREEHKSDCSCPPKNQLPVGTE